MNCIESESVLIVLLFDVLQYLENLVVLIDWVGN